MHLRHMIRKDLPEVLEIENLCFPQPWYEEHFIEALRQRNSICLVCETPKIKRKGDDVVGYMIYELHKDHIFIPSLAVHPSCWRRGIGRLLLSKIIAKLSPNRRTEIIAVTSGANYQAHMLLKAMGFKCTSFSNDLYEFKFDLLDWADDDARARQTDGRA